MQQRSELCESREEELANALSHGLGAVLSGFGLVFMLWLALPLGPWHVVGAGVFGVSLVLLYAASTLYHAATCPRRKRLFQILDHALIFVLIAGSYTPWLLVNLRGPWGWTLLAVVWGLALAGTVLKVFLLPRFDKTGTAIYLAMGWIICVALGPLMQSVDAVALLWLAAGGLCYTGGVAFYLMRRRFAHFVWHVFVMAGSFCHVVAVVAGVLTAG